MEQNNFYVDDKDIYLLPEDKEKMLKRILKQSFQEQIDKLDTM